MRIARRLFIGLLANLLLAWMHSPVRRVLRAAARARTVYLLEQVDEDARALRELRDVGIPRAFRTLAEQKLELIEQLRLLTDGDAPVSVPLPDPESIPHAAARSWSPNEPAQIGPFFRQRTQQP